MCDTFVATPSATLHREMILAKNSDREPNEAQNVTFVPAAKHPRGAIVRCTYLELPQTERTYACLLSRPFWMWGAEMGVNERGVAIGNEAVFTRERYSKTGLTGMDMLRLALERAATARAALALITELLDTYGQGGNCGFESKLYYHNSFIIADAKEAYILETADKRWVAKKVDRTASISNCLTIGEDYTMMSPGLPEYAASKRIVKKPGRVNFSRDFSDTLYTHFAKGRVRKACSGAFLEGRVGKITSSDMKALLRDHNMPEPFTPGVSPMERICLHAGGLVSTQSTGSMVAVLREKRPPLVYFTGTSAPCLSLFKPHFLTEGQKKYDTSEYSTKFDDGTVDLYGTATGSYDPRTLWWTGEMVHRRALMNYAELAPRWQRERDILESEMLGAVEEAWRGGMMKNFSKQCGLFVKTCLEKNASCALEMKNATAGLKPSVPLWFRIFWKRINGRAGFDF